MKRLVFSILIAASTLSAAAQAANEREFALTMPDGVTLGGTLTMPPDGRTGAAIVLATGSGAQNRDEEILGFRPFRTLADSLSAAGFAVLRLDDRGVGASGGDAASTTSSIYAADLRIAVDSLRRRFSVPAGIIGHSEGGSAAIKAADGCDFIITLAAPAWPGDSIVMSQARAVTEAATGSWSGEALQRRLLDMVKSSLPSIMLAPALTAELNSTLGDAARIPAVSEQLRTQVHGMCTPSYRELVRYNPADDICRVSVPWLAINGDSDMQVLPANLQTIAHLNPLVTTVLLPAHNHLFQPCVTGLPQEYSALSSPMSPQTIREIISWLQKYLAGIRNNS